MSIPLMHRVGLGHVGEVNRMLCISVIHSPRGWPQDFARTDRLNSGSVATVSTATSPTLARPDLVGAGCREMRRLGESQRLVDRRVA